MHTAASTRVLVVDDHPDVCHLLEISLTCAGFEVAVACSAGEAEARLTGERFDVVVTDRYLGDGDGEALVRASGLPAVVTSGSFAQSAVIGDRIVRCPKPFRPALLVDIVRELAATWAREAVA